MKINRGTAIALFVVISIFTMITTGCGGSVQPANKTTQVQPADAVVFNGTQHVGFNADGMTNVMNVDIAFTQNGTNVTGKAVTGTMSAMSTLKSCIELDQLTVTGTVQNSSFALILRDPNNQVVNVSGTIDPLTGTYTVDFGPTCISSLTNNGKMSGAVIFTKAGA